MCSETNILWGFSMSVYCKDFFFYFFFFYDWYLKCERIVSASSMQQNVVLRLCWMWQQVHYCIYLAWAAKWSTSPVFAYMIKQVNEATWWNETFLLEWYRRLRPRYEAELFCVKGILYRPQGAGLLEEVQNEWQRLRLIRHSVGFATLKD